MENEKLIEYYKMNEEEHKKVLEILKKICSQIKLNKENNQLCLL